MKFAKTLEDVMVPEWKMQYVQYKIGKKKIKETTNQLHSASTSPAIKSLRRSVARTHAARSPLDKVLSQNGTQKTDGGSCSPRNTHAPTEASGTCSLSSAKHNLPPHQPTCGDPVERSPLQTISSIQRVRPARSSSYGSMDSSNLVTDGVHPARPPSLHLPDPMQPIGSPNQHARTKYNSHSINLESEISNIPEVGAIDTKGSRCMISRPTTSRSGTPQQVIQRPIMQRLLTLGRQKTTAPMESRLSITEVQARAEKEFLKWLLYERQKCEEFYSIREKESIQRFNEMQEQLDIMRERWFKAKHHIPFEDDDVEDFGDNDVGSRAGSRNINRKQSEDCDLPGSSKKRVGWKSVTEAMNGLTKPHPTTSKVDILADGHNSLGLRDYERRKAVRKPMNNPAHRVAKRKLKKAYIEYYHGLEMLKSFVTVNRECFRKITKKFDKASGMRTSHRFMTEYVDKSYFGGAKNRLDDLLNDTEALFARFFERGNRKEASSRLRSRDNKSLYYSSVWRSGFCLGLAVVIATYGLYDGVHKIYDKNQPILALKTSYLLQIWGGVALMLAQVLLFAINLRVWAKNKINYVFIFEFDTRHVINYREFLELPAILCLLFAVCFWFSVHDLLGDRLNMIHFPFIFLGLTAAIFINPFKVFYYHSRKWFLRVLFRLFLSGFFPVEFKDFWIGDMLCSQTYALGTIELFFCLYSNIPKDQAQCNTPHSQTLGFFTLLPGLWRLLQCIRRYYNSKMWFPHLVNGGKYAFTVLHCMTLRIWRIDTTWKSAKAAFIVCASINSIYCTIWDVAMDWSLLDPYASHPFLRDNLGFKHSWIYYMAMFIDPIIRCDWFFYIIYAGSIQHSALLSFLLALAEVLRRFIWCFFRMENEHCGNVGANRAYRNLPLPYHFRAPFSRKAEIATGSDNIQSEAQLFSDRQPLSTSAEVDIERMEGIRRRSSRVAPGSPIVRTMTRVGRTMTKAHVYDYERRRKRPDEEPESDSDDEEDGEDYYERTAETDEGSRLRRLVS